LGLASPTQPPVTWISDSESVRLRHYYRAYYIGSDGHIFDRVEFACSGDDEAKEYAKTLANHQDVELWYNSRKIEFFKRSDL
jgi:hypothetical protein